MVTRRQLLSGMGLAALALAVGACSNRDASPAEDLRGTAAVLTLPLDGTPHTGHAATASARISWEVMVGDDEVRLKNKSIAPSSLAVTLAMLAEGATGASLASLDRALGLTGDERSAAIGALRQALAGYEDLPTSVDADDPPETPVVHQANRVVILDSAQIEQAFLDRLASYYDTGANRLPRADAKADLDAWASKHTAGLIKQSAIKIDDGLRLITQDALLFAARWRQEFYQDDVPLPFTKGDGTRVDIEALGGSFSAPHAAGDGWEAIRLAYDDVLAMDIILPEPGTHPVDLNFETINASVSALAAAAAGGVGVTMPASDIKSTWELLEALRDRGIHLDEMDRIFSGATTSQMAQQVRLTVTAKGTVGAALTEVGIAVSAPARILAVDRPFVMRVLDTRTGWPLFLAIVNDPTEKPD